MEGSDNLLTGICHRLCYIVTVTILVEGLFIFTQEISVLQLKPSFVSGITARSEGMIIYIYLITCLKERNYVAGAMEGNGMDVLNWSKNKSAIISIFSKETLANIEYF